ncbi:MAG: DUF2164 domain-containing protein [Defluviitaleaceae bacterium]|nr:DUF2164 domain-containing protein [Defluviitaleaceae bacterium]
MKKKVDTIPLTKEQRANGIDKIKEYALEHLDVKLGNLQSEMFLDFITEHFGSYYYNVGIADSMAFMTDKVEDFYLLMKDE